MNELNSISGRGRHFCPHHNTRQAQEHSQPPIHWVPAAISQGIMWKWSVHEADHSSPLSAEVNTRSCTSSHPYISMVSCLINLLTPNDDYSGRTAPLTSKRCILYIIQQIQVLNILNIVYTLCISSSKCSLFHNSNLFGSCIIHILYTGCAKIKKIIPPPKG